MMKKSWITFVLATTLLGLTGCANNNKDNAANNTGNIDVNNVRNNTNNGVNVRNVSNQNLRVSTRATNNVEGLKEVDQAHVIIRNNDAYVAVRLNNQNGTGTNAGTNGTTGAGMNVRNNEVNARGAGTGRNGNYPGTTGITGVGNTRTSLNPGTTGTNGTGGTAYKEVSSRLDQKIADQVREAHKSINNVYVSYDTNFFSQMTNYTNDIRNGRNNNGLWENFTATVDRLF